MNTNHEYYVNCFIDIFLIIKYTKFKKARADLSLMTGGKWMVFGSLGMNCSFPIVRVCRNGDKSVSTNRQDNSWAMPWPTNIKIENC